MSSIDGDLILTGTGVLRSVGAAVSSGYHADANFDSLSGRRKAPSLIVPRLITYSLPDGADATTFDIVLAGILNKAEVIAVQFIPEVIPAGGTKTFEIDLQKGNSSSAYATVLSGKPTASTSSTNRLAIDGTVNASLKDLAAGDSLKLVGTAGGSGGTNVQGGVITVLLYEHGAA